MGTTAAVHPTDQTLQAYGLGKLDEPAAEPVNRHLESCPDCTRRVAELSSDSFLGRLEGVRGQLDTGPVMIASLAGLSRIAGEANSVEPPPASSLPPGLADHPDYEVVRELGQGGMGTVYLAQNRLMGRNEVLKVVSSHLIKRRGVLDRFLGEIRNAARLHHPNIVTAYAATRIGESIVFAMEYVEGLDLSRLVKTKGPLPVAHACNFIHQAALGLQHAHEQGMVHRDIKPSNLMLSRQGSRAAIKVLDFGLAKVKSEGAVDSGLTHEGQMLGTPDYVAPEQTIDARKADIRADIYSLGCTLYYLLTGGPPFQAASLYELLQAHHSMDALPLNLARPEVPVEVAAIVAKMMAKEPERRFQQPKEVAQALTRFFKPSAAQPSVSEAEVSRVQSQVAPTQSASASPAPTQPATLDAAKAPAAHGPLKTAADGVAWDSLIEIKEDENAIKSVSPNVADPKLTTAGGSARRPPWKSWPLMAAASVFGLVVLGIIIYITTDKGRIKVDTGDGESRVRVEAGKVVVEYEPKGKSNAPEFPVSGSSGRVSSPNTTDRAAVEAEEKSPGSSTRVAVREPDIVKKSDYDAIATGKWISVLERETDLRDRTVFIPEQMAGDVIIRARVKKVSGQNLSIALRVDKERPKPRGYGAWFNGGNWFGIFKRGEKPKDLKQWHAPTNFDDYFELAFSAVGEMLTIYADGKRIGEVRDPDYRLGSLSIGALRGRSLFQGVEIMILDKSVRSTDDKNFVPLFNLRDLEGWKDELVNNSEWNVVEGVLEGRGSGDTGGPAVLHTERSDFSNFRLRLQVQNTDGMTCVVVLRRPATENGSPQVSGYAVAVGGPANGRAEEVPLGSIARISRTAPEGIRTFDAVSPAVAVGVEEWQSIEITAIGGTITTEVDGKKAAEFTDRENAYATGTIALACRRTSKFRVKDILIEELPKSGIGGLRTGELEKPAAFPAVEPQTLVARGPVREEIRPFNGRDFEGWNGLYNVNDVIDPSKVFRIEGEELVWAGHRGRIFTNNSYRDFSFKFEYLLPLNGRYGTTFCVLKLAEGDPYQISEANFRVSQVGCALTNGQRGVTGDIVLDNSDQRVVAQRSADATRPANEWNDVEVRCEGRQISFFLNGRQVNRVEGNRDILCHPGLNSWDADIRFRNIRIIPLVRAGSGPSPKTPGRSKAQNQRASGKTTKNIVADALQPGTVWAGTWTFEDPGYSGRVASYKLIITESFGNHFKAESDFKFDTFHMRSAVEGTIQGDRIEYDEVGREKWRFSSQGTIVGNEISCRFQGTGSGGIASFGKGLMKLQEK